MMHVKHTLNSNLFSW